MSCHILWMISSVSGAISFFLKPLHESAWRPHNLIGTYLLKVKIKDQLQEPCLRWYFWASPEGNIPLSITDGYPLKSDALIWVILIGSICEQKALACTSNSVFVEVSCQRLNKHELECLQTISKHCSSISPSSYQIFVKFTSFPTIVRLGVSISCFYCNIDLTSLMVVST